MNEENINKVEEKSAENFSTEEVKADINQPVTQQNNSNNNFNNNYYVNNMPQSYFYNQNMPLYSQIFIPTKEQIEKAEVKKLGRVSGVSFLIFVAVTWAVNIFLIVLFKLLSTIDSEIFNMLYEPAFQQVQQIIFSILAFTVPFITVYKLFGYRISDLISFKVPRGKDNFYLFLMGISFCAFSNIVSSIAGQLFDSAGIEYEVDFGDNPEGFFGFMLSFIAMSIVPALVEEFACRGILLGSLRKQGEAFGIITSATLFGLMHSNFEQIPFALLVGLILGYITIKADTIWVAVGVHFFNNFIPVIYNNLLNGLPYVVQNISYTIYLIVSMLIGLFAISKIKNKENIFALSEDTSSVPLAKRLKWYFLSVPIIIFTVYCLLTSLQFLK